MLQIQIKKALTGTSLCRKGFFGSKYIGSRSRVQIFINLEPAGGGLALNPEPLNLIYELLGRAVRLHHAAHAAHTTHAAAHSSGSTTTRHGI